MMTCRYRSSSSASCRAYSSSLVGAIREEAAGLAEGVHQDVHLFQRIVHVEAGPRRTRDAQAAHERLRAVVAGAHGHAVAVQDGADVMRVQVGVVHGDDTAAVVSVRRPVDDQPLKLAQAAQGVLRDLGFVGAYVLHPEVVEVVDGGAEGDHVGDVGSARFELPGDVVPGGALLGHPLDHLAAGEERLHPLQQLAAAVEDTDARGAEHLVAGEGEEVAVHRLDVHRHVGHALGAVHQHDRAVAVGLLREPLDGVDRAHGVGDVRQRQQARAGIHQVLQPVELQRLAVRYADVAHGGALFGGEALPGDDVGVVLQQREEHLRVRPDVGAAPGVGDQVDRLRGVAGENDALRRGGVDERRYLRPRLLVGVRRLFAQAVDGAVNVGVVMLVVADQRLDHLARLLRGRRVIEVDQRPAVDLAGEYREVLPDAGHVQATAGRSAGALPAGDGANPYLNP